MGEETPVHKAKKESYPDLEKLPSVRFEQMNIDEETRLFAKFMESSTWSLVFDRVYPELRVIQRETPDESECLRKYRKFIKGIRARDEKQLVSAQEKIREEWGKVSQAFLEVLSEHFETSWPEDKDEIKGYLSVLPAYPRFLDKYSFCTGYKNIHDAIETSAHEILHFLWFKKWKEVFPEAERKEFESPSLVWRLSEIMDQIILQCHPKIKELIRPSKWGYSSFKDIKIGEISMTEHFKRAYMQSVSSGDNFETTIKKLWEEAKKHEKEISGF
jgi:hypothetical protein